MGSRKAGPKLLELVNSKLCQRHIGFKKKLMEQICESHKLISISHPESRMNVGMVGGERSYMLLGSLAKLERALSKWALKELVSKHGFTPVIVPNILHDHIIESCGFPTKAERTQVYKIAKADLPSNDMSPLTSCLAGTSEFALTSIHIGGVIPENELPKKYCALSRCYRAETSSTSSESGIYRVHYFNKVEMVALTLPEKSEEMHDEFLEVQKSLFKQLNLRFQILEMPEDDLAASASKKYDIEAWMDGRQRYGEISSTSNCSSYQSSRLNIRYSKLVERSGQLHVDEGYVHSINGTACSSIRTLIAVIEQNQSQDGTIQIPEPLVPFMDGVESIPTVKDALRLKHLDLLNLNKK